MPMILLKFLAITTLFALANGCASGQASRCDGWSAIRPTVEDVEVISDPLVTQVLKHNAHGAAVCGWKP